MTTQTVEAAYECVLQQSSCSLKRDSVNLRILDEIRHGTAKYGKSSAGGSKGIIDSQVDEDHDGMDDRWELSQGLNPKDQKDGNAIKDGYTNLEHELNSLVMK